MISLKGVTKNYGDVVALKKIHMDVEPGIVYGLLGPNGSGKSTLLKVITGLVRPDSGAVSVDGLDPAIDALALRRVVGYSPEEIVLYESLTPAETFSFVAGVYGISIEESEGRTRLLAKLFGLEDQMGKPVGELSHGNRKKVMLASALIHDPKVLLLDESFSGLDPEAGRVLKEMLKKYTGERRTILVSTHVLELAEVVAERVIIMRTGEIAAIGTLEELRAKMKAKDLEEVFMETTGLTAGLRDLLEALRGM